MSEQNNHLPDGQYECFASLHIKDGKAFVILNSTFGLQPGTTIPLLRKEGNILVDHTSVGEFKIRNGLTII
jgi:hypothetical protein